MSLDELLPNTNDISNPACFEEILIRLECITAEDEEFMQLLVDKLKDAVITWDQPWYQRSNCLTRAFKETNVEPSCSLEEYHTDSITKAESDRMEKNWRKFRKQFDIPDKLASFARWKNKDKSRNPNTPEESVRRFVTAYLARGLKRNLHQVYRHIVTHLSNPVRGPYSPTEEKLMEICFQHKPTHAVTYLSMILSREPRGIYKRLQQKYKGKPLKKKLKWTLPLASKFVNLLIQYSKSSSIEELKNRRFEKSVWLNLEKDMDQQYIYLQKFWYDALHVQIFVKENVTLNGLRKKVFTILQDSSYQVWRDIRWKELLNFFPDGFTHTFLYKISLNIFRSNLLCLKQPLTKILEYAFYKIRINHRNKQLRNLIHKDGYLNVIHYNNVNSKK
ncbi:unnamed protein product [Parnassius mnemosyne]|uniref:Uncharacterized protein n=1 Tax=Parnassius mnemosyne TaxID=213953 RepID=A0AAV1M581_9NEOP